MHRATPANSSFRGYSAGGARTTIDKIDDGKLMQEMSGSMMKGESRSKVESPQNYGFTSMVMPADKDKDGNVTGSAEGFMSFMGGNRSFPVCGVMDDRRHRLKDVKEGDSAMYRTKEDRQQFHMSGDGNFMSCRDDRIQRFALVPKEEEEQQQGGKQQGGGSGGGGEGGQQDGKKKATGQKSAMDDNKKSETFIEQSKDAITSRRGKGYTEVKDDSVTNYVEKPSRSSRAHKDHVHESFDGNTIWVDASGCWASMPILIKDDPCSPSPAAPGEPAAPAKPV